LQFYLSDHKVVNYYLSFNISINQYRLMNRKNRLKVPADTAAAGAVQELIRNEQSK